jgi:hypothetical protein
MGILKQKIAQARKLQELQQQKQLQHMQIPPLSCNISQLGDNTAPLGTEYAKKLRQRPPRDVPLPSTFVSAKNIMKNYAKAFTSFAGSAISEPYLVTILKEELISLDRFRELVNERKADVNCIHSLRELLLARKDDNEQMLSFKRTFQKICVIFLKFFCVNWIFSSSKMSDKKTHLKYRFKILRRINDPVHFTYLEGNFKHW